MSYFAPQMTPVSCVLRDDAAKHATQLGGKAKALAALSAAGFPVPRWIVVTSDALAYSLSDCQRELLAAAATCEEATAALEGIRLAPELEAEVLRELRTLGDDARGFAVRSSARDEDSAEHSFAGQLESYLFVSMLSISTRLADVWRSGFSERVFAYRREQKLSGPPTAPAVLIQEMVDAEVSGVAFSADPVTGNRDVAVVGSLFGLGTALVSGEADADTHRIHRNGKILSRELATKTREHRFSPLSPDGVGAVKISKIRATEWALSDEEAVAVAALARRAEEFFGSPQDIEWACAGGELHLLQSRPITSLGAPTEPMGVLNVWDNSNIAESYDGVTTPLTFSFARHAYEGVYTELCRIFGTPEKRIASIRPSLENMIGLIHGRVYYNVLNWYRLLRECPGYRVNAAFFEQMIGLREPIPEDALEHDNAETSRSVFMDVLRVLRTSVSILGSFITLQWRVRQFHRRVEAALDDCPDLTSLSADALVREYRLLVDRLITRWDAPLINDFFAMIFYGCLRKSCVNWCDDESGTLQNELLCAAGGIVSTEPVARMKKMAHLARRDRAFVDLLRRAPAKEVLAAMAPHEDFRQEFESYLAKFGERCSEELKLESPSLHDDPRMLFRAVGSLAYQSRDRASRRAPMQPSSSAAAEARVRVALKDHPLRRALFHWVHRNARMTIRNRENLRLERTRVFGRVRRIFVELGRRLHGSSVLKDPHDVFYLRVEELLAYVDGTATTTHLAGLAALRRAEFARFSDEPAPPDRFETRGPVYLDSSYLMSAGPKEIESGDARQGTGCCPGKVRGRVRVVKDPRTVVLEHGDILVAERTDPGWIMLFPFASGLLIERGNLLSHSAIVAREMGIPAIVAIDGVTRWLHDGDAVEFDGASGVVRKLPGAGEEQ